MNDIILCVFVFAVCVFFHILFFRALSKKGKKSFRTVIILFFGFIFLLFLYISRSGNSEINLNRIVNPPLPVTGLILYLIFIGIFLIYFANAYIGEGSPSSKIYFLVKRKKKVNYEDIRNEFSDYDLIHKRLKNLTESGLITKKDARYTAKGRIIVSLFNYYRSVLGFELGG